MTLVNPGWRLAAALVIVLGAALAVAEDAEGKGEAKKGGRKHDGPRAPSLLLVETIAQKLGADLPLTDEQKAKIEAARKEVLQKYEDVMAKAEVKAAGEEVAKAAEELKRAQAKLKEATGGFSPTDEYKKALDGILTDAQKQKLSPSGKGEHKKDEGKKAAPKEDAH